MTRYPLLLALALLAAVPAHAGEDARPRLVSGGMAMLRPEGARFTGADVKAPMVTRNGMSVGALLDSTPAAAGEAERSAVGGFAGYAVEGVDLGASIRGDATAQAADISASYLSGVGRTALSLGYEWGGRMSSFSLNPWQPATAMDGWRPMTDLSVALTFTHDVTSALSLGGFAAATRSEYEDSATERGFRVGAGLGYRF